jgi:O-antigen ligase
MGTRPETSPSAGMACALAALWACMPLYPSFIALLPIAPPGLALLGPLPAVVLLAAVGLLTAYVGAVLWRDAGPALFRDPLLRAMGLYLATLLFASLLGLVPIVGIVFFIITLCTVIGVSAVRRWGADPRVARCIALALLASSTLADFVALLCYASRQPAQLYAVGNGRAIGTFVVPGELAGYLGMLLPYTLGLAWTARTPWISRLAWGAAILDGVTMVLTFSRAGLFGLVVAGIAISLVLRRRLWPWIVAGIVVMPALLRKLVNLHHNPAENFNRLSIWHAAGRVMMLFPLWGVGPGGFAHIYPLVQLPGGEPNAFHAHSFFLTVAAETGLIGLIGTAVMWTTFARMFGRAYVGASSRARIAGLCIAAGFIATWVQSTVDVVQVLFLGLWIPFMGMALVALEEGSP